MRRLWHCGEAVRASGKDQLMGSMFNLLLIPGDAGDISGGELHDAPLKSEEEGEKKRETPPQKNWKDAGRPGKADSIP